MPSFKEPPVKIIFYIKCGYKKINIKVRKITPKIRDMIGLTLFNKKNCVKFLFCD